MSAMTPEELRATVMASTNSNVETMSKIVATLVDALEKMEVRVDSQFDSISKKEHDMELMIDNLAHNLQDADMHVHEAEAEAAQRESSEEARQRREAEEAELKARNEEQLKALQDMKREAQEQMEQAKRELEESKRQQYEQMEKEMAAAQAKAEAAAAAAREEHEAAIRDHEAADAAKAAEEEHVARQVSDMKANMEKMQQQMMREAQEAMEKERKAMEDALKAREAEMQRIREEHEAQARANEEKEAQLLEDLKEQAQQASKGGAAAARGAVGGGAPRESLHKDGVYTVQSPAARRRWRWACQQLKLRRLTKKMGLARTRVDPSRGIGGRLQRVEAATADLQLGLGKLRTTVEEMATAAADPSARETRVPGEGAEAMDAVALRLSALEETAAAVASDVAAAVVGLDGAVERVKDAEARLEALELARILENAEDAASVASAVSAVSSEAPSPERKKTRSRSQSGGLIAALVERMDAMETKVAELSAAKKQPEEEKEGGGGGGDGPASPEARASVRELKELRSELTAMVETLRRDLAAAAQSSAEAPTPQASDASRSAEELPPSPLAGAQPSTPVHSQEDGGDGRPVGDRLTRLEKDLKSTMKVFDGVRKQVKSKAGITEVSNALDNIGVQLQLITSKNNTITTEMESKIDRETLERLLSGQDKEEEIAAKEIEVGKPFFAVYRCKKPFRPQGLASLYDENRSVLSFEETSQTLYEGSLPDLYSSSGGGGGGVGVGGGGSTIGYDDASHLSLGSNRVGDSVVSGGGGGGGSGSGGKQRRPRTALGLSSPERADAERNGTAAGSAFSQQHQHQHQHQHQPSSSVGGGSSVAPRSSTGKTKVSTLGSAGGFGSGGSSSSSSSSSFSRGDGQGRPEVSGAGGARVRVRTSAGGGMPGQIGTSSLLKKKMGSR